MRHGIALADTHSGHRAGLTPPAWQWPIRSGNKQVNKWGKTQRECWNAYMEIAEWIKPPVDFLLFLGDAIDGKGEASGGTEIIQMDRHVQCEMAIEALKVWEARQVVAVYGTSYHAGKLEDFETVIARTLGGEIHSEPFVDLDGVVFGLKHHISVSSIPHGRGTAIAKDKLWNVLWAEWNEQPSADVILRGHAHYFSYIGGRNWLGMILPALQAAQTKYGGRRCNRTVDWGLVEFWCEGGEYRWKAHLANLKANKTETIKL